MKPNEIAAHQIAEHVRAIARLLPSLSADAMDAYLPGYRECGINSNVRNEIAAMLERKAASLEASAPFEPVPDERKDEIFREVLEEVGDLSAKDIARDYCNLTEAMWRAESDNREEAAREDAEWEAEHAKG